MTISDDRLEVIRAAQPNNLELAYQAASLYPQNHYAQFWLAENLTEAGDKSGAIKAYENGLLWDKKNGLAWRKLGDLYNQEGDWENAVKAYDQACKLVDLGKNGCFMSGTIYLDHGYYDLAENKFRKSVDQLPDWLPSKKGLVDALLAQGKIDEALI